MKIQTAHFYQQRVSPQWLCWLSQWSPTLASSDPTTGKTKHCRVRIFHMNWSAPSSISHSAYPVAYLKQNQYKPNQTSFKDIAHSLVANKNNFVSAFDKKYSF